MRRPGRLEEMGQSVQSLPTMQRPKPSDMSRTSEDKVMLRERLRAKCSRHDPIVEGHEYDPTVNEWGQHPSNVPKLMTFIFSQQLGFTSDKGALIP